MGNKLLSYAVDFCSFLLQKTLYRPQIKSIILFGSVAREEAGKESDVDLFIDLIKDDPKIAKEIEKIQEDFLKSTKYKNYWQLLGIENSIKVTMGTLGHWKQLQPSLLSNGITLYGKYLKMPSEGRHTVFLVWENVKPNSKRVLFNKQLLGYTYYQKFYLGLLQKYKGEKLGKGCIAVPLEHSTEFLKLFRKYKVNVKIKKVLEYT